MPGAGEGQGVPVTDDLQQRTAANRRAIADLCAGLTEDQLDRPSLCRGWACRDVLGHLVVNRQLSFPRFLLEVLHDRGRASHTSERLARVFGARPAAELVGGLRAHADDVDSPPGVGPGGPFSDAVLHLRDIAVPLGLAATAPVQDWVRVLEFLVTPRARRAGFLPRGRLDGLHLVATDLPWCSGDGALVTGPAEALAMAATGRTVGLDDLTGDGVPVLRARTAAD